MNILLVRPRGFCAGVDRAIDIVDIALELYGPPIYVKHEIVHNTHVVERLREKGAMFVETVDDIPKGANGIFSAHGSPPADYEKAKERGINLVDSVCPLVTKVHFEARRYAKDQYTILLIGHHGHVETVGTIGEAPDNTILIETVDEARDVSVADEKKVVCLSQTTLSLHDTKEIIDVLKSRFPAIILPPSSDICYATTNRQTAVKKLAEKADCVLVVGSRSSSNSNRLREVAEASGIPAYLIDSAEDIDSVWLKGVHTVGITAGASAPENLVFDVVDLLRKQHGANTPEELLIIDEQVRFPLPERLMQEVGERGEVIPQIQKHVVTQEMVIKTRKDKEKS